MKVMKLLLFLGLSIFQAFGMEPAQLASKTFIDHINEKISKGDEAGLATFLRNNPQLNWLNVYASSCVSHPDIKMPFDFAVERLCKEPKAYNAMVMILYALHDHAYTGYSLGKNDFEFLFKFIGLSQALNIVASCDSPRKSQIEKTMCNFFDSKQVELVDRHKNGCRNDESLLGHLSVDSSCLELVGEAIAPHSLPPWERPVDDLLQSHMVERFRRDLSIPLPPGSSNGTAESTVVEPPFVQALRLALNATSLDDKKSHCAVAKILFNCNQEPFNFESILPQLKSDMFVLVFLADMGIKEAINAIQEIHCGN